MNELNENITIPSCLECGSLAICHVDLSEFAPCI
jgi:hypothetical protein